MALDLRSKTENLYSIGEDATQNFFEFEIVSLPENVKNMAMNLNIPISEGALMRVSKFSLPDDELSTVELNIRGVKTARILGRLNTATDLQLDLIVDRKWNYYLFFKQWKDNYGNMNEDSWNFIDIERTMSGTANTPASSVISITNALLIVGDNNTNHVRWQFFYARPYKISGINFDYASGEPVSMTVNFKFSSYTVDVV